MRALWVLWFNDQHIFYEETLQRYVRYLADFGTAQAMHSILQKKKVNEFTNLPSSKNSWCSLDLKRLCHQTSARTNGAHVKFTT